MGGGRDSSTCADEIRTFCQPSPVGEGGSRRLTDEVSFLDKATFPLSYFSVKKSTKSHLRGLSSLLKNTLRVHELVAGSSAWQVRAAQNKAKIGSFAAPHDFSYTTRANKVHEEAEQIRARIVCTPAINAGRAWIW